MTPSTRGLAYRLRSIADELVELQAIVVPEETPEAALVAMREAHAALLDARRALTRLEVTFSV